MENKETVNEPIITIDNEEYKISALCLICQEEFFKESEDE